MMTPIKCIVGLVVVVLFGRWIFRHGCPRCPRCRSYAVRPGPSGCVCDNCLTAFNPEDYDS